MIAGINLRADRFQRQFKRLHSIDAANRNGNGVVRPLDFGFACPMVRVLLGRMEANRNFNVTDRPPQPEHARSDDNGTDLVCAMRRYRNFLSFPTSKSRTLLVTGKP